MNQSNSVLNIGPALLNAQKHIKSAVKDATNPFFKSKYSTLENVMDACKDALNNEGIVVLQPVGCDEVSNFVETTLLHASSGEFVTSRMRVILTKEDMQNLGSAISYCRRYSLQSLVFLGSADDDGEAAMVRSAPSVSKSNFKPKAAAFVQSLTKDTTVVTTEPIGTTGVDW